MDDLEKVRAMCDKLHTFWWSEAPPWSYVLKRGNVLVGVGLIKDLDYAAFNIAWAKCSETLKDEPSHVRFIVAYGEAKVRLGTCEVVRSMICLLPRREFKLWLSGTKDVPELTRQYLHSILGTKLIQL